MYIIGLVIFLLGVFLVMFLKGISMLILLNPAAIVIHIFAIIAVLAATSGFGVFLQGFKAVIMPRSAMEKSLRIRAISLFRLLTKTAVLASLIGMTIAIIAGLSHIDDIYALSHALASSLVMPLWGMTLIAAVFEPVVVILKDRKTHGK